MKKQYKTLELEGEWFAAFGKPERNGAWFIWGNSGNGKTVFTLQLCKELSKFGTVLYNSLEEGDSKTMRDAIIKAKMEDVADRFFLLKDNMTELRKKLDKRKSAEFVVIDSIQYTQMDFTQYREFVARYPRKLLIFISQADGRQPLGRTAKSVMYDASLKIWVEGYKAYSKGRYIGANGGIYTIWAEGSQMVNQTI
jgi:pantothenate kinase-related protein Tda10